jgi:hypothetical protein
MSESKDPRILHLFQEEPLLMPPGIDSVLDNLDQDVWDQINGLSGSHPFFENDEIPYFGDLIDELLKRTSEIPKEERKDYIEKAHDFWLILAGYDDPYFAKNFFGYLFDRTRDMDDRPKKDFVLNTKFVYDSAVTVLYGKIGEEVNPESLVNAVRPHTNLKENLGFGRRDYRDLKNELKIRRVLDDGKEIYEKQTVADIAELIADKQAVSSD